MHAADKTSLNINIGSYVLKVLTNNTSGTGKNIGVCFNFRLPDNQKKKTRYDAVDSVRTFSVVIVGPKSSKRKFEPHP